MSENTGKLNSNTVGAIQSDAGHLDLHFRYCEPEYTAMLKAANFQNGWHVLDAGCGNGAFLPLIADEIGPSGHITAVDMAEESINAVHSIGLAQLRDARVADVTDLPFDNDSFDAVWSANVAMYLNDEDLIAMLREFHRVTRPRGLLAIKDYDITLNLVQPGNPSLFTRFFESAIGHDSLGNIASGALRASNLTYFLQAAGFENVRLSTTIVERHRPEHDFEVAYLHDIFSTAADMIEMVQPSPQDAEAIKRLADVESPSHVLNDPSFYYREGAVLALGSVP